MTSLVTLIPAYKKEYLAELFLGLRTQTHKDFKIVLSDDSPAGEITELIRAGHHDHLIGPLNLLVVRGPRLGSLKNIQHLLEGWGGLAPLVHIHLDDDVMYPDFYREHLRAHGMAELGASVSLRWVTDSNGRPAASLPVPGFIDNHDARLLQVPAEAMFQSCVPDCQNWLGEISNTVLSAEGVRLYHAQSMEGLSYYGLGDVGTLLNVSRHAPIGFIRDHLSGFRSNPLQSSAQLQSFGMKCGHLAWAALALAARRDGRISEDQAFHSLATTVQRSAQLYRDDAALAGFFGLVQQHSRDLDAFDAAFETFWHGFLATDSDSRPRTVALACGPAAPATPLASRDAAALLVAA